MKKRQVLRFAITIIGVMIYTIPVSAQNNNLTITFKNIKNKDGKVIIGLYNKHGEFPKKGKEYKQAKVQVKGQNELNYTFYNLPADDYAVALYHDENNDNECNTNVIGYPVEPFGFSNNIKPKLSAPSFQQAKVKVNEDKKIIIKLIK